MNTSITKHLPYLLFISVLMMACLFAGGTAFADPPGRKHVVQRHETHRGRVVANRHGDQHRPYVRKARHYQRRSHFYRKRPHFSLFVGAPIRTSITTLPAGYTRVVVRGASYYVAGGVYYQHILGGYRVVEVPRPVVVVDNPPQQPKPVTLLPEQVKVSAAALNVRTGPGLHHEVIHQVRRGDTLQVINSEPGWLLVRLPSGQSGWVMDSFTTPIGPLASG
jgi:hypothetical protein